MHIDFKPYHGFTSENTSLRAVASFFEMLAPGFERFEKRSSDLTHPFFIFICARRRSVNYGCNTRLRWPGHMMIEEGQTAEISGGPVGRKSRAGDGGQHKAQCKLLWRQTGGTTPGPSVFLSNLGSISKGR